ncbi:MAG: mucoidy inhibitor MuiA family protein [Bacteroidota bacterium]|nr:mucoidy inhibitor MuiA family protein [Bacteroidota bacterium]
MKKNFLIIGIILSCALVNAQNLPRENVDTARADAEITNATVYFGYGAELTHTAKVKGTPSTKIIIINHLSTSIDVNSLQISCPEDVTLLSQQYNLYYPLAPPVAKSKDIEKLEDSIQVINKDINHSRNSIDIEQEVLTKTGNLIEATVSTSGNKTITSSEVLKLLEFYTAKIEKAKTNIFNYHEKINQANERIDELRKKISILNTNITVAKPEPYGQLILQVICKNSGEIPVALSYYTNNAGWMPVYDIRVNSKTNKVKLVYKASLTQTTGIDWKKTKLTLSTGTPNFGVAAPVLSPWYLQLYVPDLYRQLQGMVPGVKNRIQSMGDDRKLGEVVIKADPEGYKEKDIAASIDPSTLQQFTTLSQGQLNTNFDIDLPYDIESDGKLHSVAIKDQEIDCILKNYAIPRIDKETYLLAEVADWQNLDLLPGDANIIMDNTYIGKSAIDPNTTSDTLNLSLGKDKRLAVKRSLVKEMSSLKSSGGNNKQTFTYEITVKNNKLTDVSLLLKDQYPLSTIKEVEVKLEDNGEAMVNEEAGVLTWKIGLKPGESKKVRFTYSVKYPKDKKIVNLK